MQVEVPGNRASDEGYKLRLAGLHIHMHERALLTELRTRDTSRNHTYTEHTLKGAVAGFAAGFVC